MKYFVSVDEARQDSVSLFLQPHLEEDTGELSESEALLGYARSTTVLPEPRSPTLDRLARHCQGDLSAITKRLEELASQKGACKLKYREMISKDQIHDVAIEQRYAPRQSLLGTVCS
jgi:hypothetical protein